MILKAEPKNKDYWQLLWLKFRAGDRDSFEEIYQEFADKLFTYGSKMTSDREMVKDCIQDLFIIIYKNSPDLRNPEYLEYYLYKSLKRSILKKLKKENRLETLAPDYISFDLIFNAEKEGYLDNSGNEQMDLLTKALKGLDAKKRELLFLKFESGLNNEEIGNLLDMKPETVKKQVYRIVRYLRTNYSAINLELLFLYRKML